MFVFVTTFSCQLTSLSRASFDLSVTFGMTSTTMYYYTKVMSDLFLDTGNNVNGGTFRTITSVEDFWRVCFIVLFLMEFEHGLTCGFQQKHC